MLLVVVFCPRLIGGIPKFFHTSSFISTSLHWLPIRQRIQFKICSLVRNCLTGSAPQYLKAYCIPVTSIPSRLTLRSSARGHLLVPRTRTSMIQSGSFSIVGPSKRNKLPQSLRDPWLLTISSDQFRKHLNTSLFVSEESGAPLIKMALYKSLLPRNNPNRL